MPSEWSLTLLFIGIVLPIGVLSYLYANLADYQQFRIQSFFQTLKGTAPSSFINRCANTMIADSKWIGASIEMADSQYQLMVSNEYIITQLTAAYGMLFGLIVTLSLIMLMSHIFHITRKQKNQLGYMIGSGCGLIFLVMVIEGILVNLGIFPPTMIRIPFLTYGSSATITYDILLGMVLSVYRYQNILSDEAFQPKWKLSLKIEKTMKE